MTWVLTETIERTWEGSYKVVYPSCRVELGLVGATESSILSIRSVRSLTRYWLLFHYNIVDRISLSVSLSVCVSVRQTAKLRLNDNDLLGDFPTALQNLTNLGECRVEGTCVWNRNPRQCRFH